MRGIRWRGALVVVMAGVWVASCTTVPPGVFPPMTGATQVAAGLSNTCAVITGGSVKCWGDNSSGQLGSAVYATNPYASVPVGVTGMGAATQVASGGTHTCAVLSSGGVTCWGDNYFGQLGDGTVVDSDTAVNVIGISNAIKVAAAQYSTCALLADGTVECWGSIVDRRVPEAIPGVWGATDVVVGCALVSGGSVACWGVNPWGNLGDGTTTSSTTAVSVIGISGATQIAGEAGHHCALMSGGNVRCWGFGRQGQLGNGTNADVNSTPVDVVGISGATEVNATASHTCVLLPGGTIKCWGSNYAGALGDRTKIDRNLPVGVIGVTGAVEVDTGSSQSCARFNAGAMRCWGQNSFGELGNGSLTDSLVPVDVLAGP